jgi:PhoH-like ATPase
MMPRKSSPTKEEKNKAIRPGKKIFLIDTCIFIDDPDCISRFDVNEIVIPFKVLEELDKHKEATASKAEGARHALRNIYNLTQQGKVSVGVPLSNGGLFRVDMTDVTKLSLPVNLNMDDPDNSILAVAWHNQQQSKRETVLITNDINLKIKSEALDIKTEKYENRTVKKIEHLFSPYQEIKFSSDEIDNYIKNGYINPPKDSVLLPNESILIKSYESSQSALGRYSFQNKRIEKLRNADNEVFNIKPRNLEQRFALDLLLDDKLSLVTVCGKAGTGKTILALVSALRKTIEERKYKRIIIARPIVSLSKAHEIGYIPGDMSTKLFPWMQPILDNLEVILDLDEGSEEGQRSINSMMDRGIIEFNALGYIRGRSIDNAYIIIDEAQQLLPREAKAIITRVSGNSKIVLLGDQYQIDSSYLDEYTNGLSYTADKFKNQPIAGRATLTKCERSALSAIAADIL